MSNAHHHAPAPLLRLAPGYDADLIRLLESRGLATAASGGGKSWLLRLIIEQALPHTQVLVIDPEGEFHTLREKFDLLICAPSGADAVAIPATAGILVRSLLETGVSAVFNIYDLKAHERQAFVREFCEALVDAPRPLWHNVLIVIDEAHIFCPEGGKSESGQAVIDLATRGRKRGFGLMLATQRLAKLHKDAAGEMLNKLIGRTSLNNDVKRAADELGETQKDMLAKLRSLKPGEWFAYGPAFPDGVQRIKVNPVVTTHPQPGKRLQEPPPAPSPAIRKLLEERLRDLPKQAREEAATLAQLQDKLADARRVIAHLSKHECKPGIDEEQVKARIKAAEDRGFNLGAESIVGPAAALNKALSGIRDDIETIIGGLPAPQPQPIPRAAMRDNTPGKSFLQAEEELGTHQADLRPFLAESSEYPGALNVKSIRVVDRALTSEQVTAGQEARKGLSAPQVTLIDTLARLETLGVRTASRTSLAVHADVGPRSSGYENNLGRLRSLGLLDYPAGGMVALTDAGRAAADSGGRPLTLAGFHDAWARAVTKPQAAILRHLIEVYPMTMTRDQLAAAINVGAKSSGYENNLGHLRGLGSIHYPDRGHVQAADLLFPPGLK
jgi:hypothetical protein